MATPVVEAEHESSIPNELPIQNHRFRYRVLFCIVLAVALALYVGTRFWEQPSGGDRANWDYMAQVIARGGVPYRDAVNIKTPLSAYIGAIAILVLRPFGVSDVMATRSLFIFLAALTVALTYLVGVSYFRDVAIGLLSAAVTLSFHSFARFNGGGVQPKTPMILFGLLSLWAISKDRPWLAGFSGMLSALSWQPGLLFVGVGGLAFSGYLTQPRNPRLWKMVLSSLIPLLVMLVFFMSVGALREFYRWTIDFNASVYGPEQARTMSAFFDHFLQVMGSFYASSVGYFVGALIGLLIAIGLEIRLVFNRPSPRMIDLAPRHVVIIAPLVYFGFCAVDFQSGPDIIPLLPFVGMFAAFALIQLINWYIKTTKGFGAHALKLKVTIAGLVATAILVRGGSDLITAERQSTKLPEQVQMVVSISSLLQPGDTIYVHGRTEVLVLGGLTNASRHFFLDRGKDRYLDKDEPGGFAGWLDRLKAERPKIVIIDRLGSVDRAAYLQSWVAEEYVARASGIFPYYLRKDYAE